MHTLVQLKVKLKGLFMKKRLGKTEECIEIVEIRMCMSLGDRMLGLFFILFKNGRIFLCLLTLVLRNLQCYCNYVFSIFRQTGQDTTEEIRSRDFRQELEERERIAAKDKSKEKGHRSYGESSTKKSRLEMLTTSNLDLDDPVDDDDDDDSDDRYSRIKLVSVLLDVGKKFFINLKVTENNHLH